MALPTQNGGGVIQVVHTDDAVTKLSDRVRCRCFNYCTTDTSTWRRSNLPSGKVLCNKCGVFERAPAPPSSSCTSVARSPPRLFARARPLHNKHR
ncbi:hypothetical protein C8R44DRAFT_723424 [Mycena epipterygia]|nr:hypothetical protein C8R44DRAFT_723424 [Mycena epipterygia]